MSSGDVSSAGLLLVGHGTRSERGRAEMRQLTELIAARLPGVPVQPCFLELAEPTIEAGVARLAELGVQQLVVSPLMLFAAGHAKRDIPCAVSEAAQRFSKLTITHLPHFGCQPEMIELSAKRYYEVGQALPLDVETALVLVGRGSHDAEATAEMLRLANLRAKRTQVGRALACFLAMAEPGLDTALVEIAGEGWPRIVVQPHLLFHGDLLDRLHDQVAAARQRWPDRQWLIAEHLGPAPPLAELVAAQFVNCAAAR